MLVKPLRSMVGDYGHIKRDVPVELDDITAKRLIDAGRVVPLDGKIPAAASRPQSSTQKGAPLNPPEPRRTGGQTGAGKSSSVSEAGQAPQKRRSKKSAPPAQD
jgi:hypothetical protein